MRAFVLPVTALMLGGCAAFSWTRPLMPAAAPADYLVNALAADPAARDAMWQAAQKEPDGEDARLHRALLRSIPGQAIYDPVAADAALKELLTQDPSADVARTARARLEDLKAIAACRGDVEDLKRRLSKVADIEKRLDRERH